MILRCVLATLILLPSLASCDLLLHKAGRAKPGGGVGTPGSGIPNSNDLVARWLVDESTLSVDSGCAGAFPSTDGYLQCWKDQTATGYDLTTTRTDIYYRVSAFNSLPSIDLGGGNGQTLKRANADSVLLDLDGTDAFTIYAAVRFEQTGRRYLVARFSAGTSGVGWGLAKNTSEQLSLFLTKSAGSSDLIWVDSTTAFTNNTEYYIVVTYSGSGAASGAQFWINGNKETMIEQLDALSGAFTSTADLEQCRGGAECFSGQVREIGVYDVALAESSVSVLNAYLAEAHGFS